MSGKVVFSLPGKISREELLRIQSDTGMKVSTRCSRGRTLIYGVFRKKKELAEAIGKLGYATATPR